MNRPPPPFLPNAQVIMLSTGQPRGFPFAFDSSIKFPIYRYIRREHADKFFDSGLLRIGTLWSYHDVGSLGQEMGDRKEGHRAVTTIQDGSGDVCFTSASAINQWMMSFTADKDDRFFDEFNADCCLEISSLEFFLELSQAMAGIASIGVLRKVQYMDDQQFSSSILDAVKGMKEKMPSFAATKYPRYSWQAEIRLIFEPHIINNDVKTIRAPDMGSSRVINDMQKAAQFGAEMELIQKNQRTLDNHPIMIRCPNAVKFAKLT